MITMLIVLLTISTSVVTVGTESRSSLCKKALTKFPPQDCKTWKYKEQSHCLYGGSNETDNFLRAHWRDESKLQLSKGYCITFDETTNLTYTGKCPYDTIFDVSPMFYIPSNVTDVNTFMCGPLNRTGILCSQCQSGLGPAVFSFHRECKECLSQPYGWILFFVRLVVPLTLFCVLVIVFRINIASPALNGFVLVAQLIVNVFNSNPFIVFGLVHHYTVAKFVADFYGLFNLDFLTYLIPSFCISENLNIMTVLALEYLVPLYPIVFTLAMYCLISLHDRGCKVIIICWKPFRKCWIKFRRSWELRGSVINAFATFLLLSYSKFCIVSWNLLRTVTVWDICTHQSSRVYFSADLSNIGIAYLVITVVISFFIILVPALFILFYQVRIFQKCLSICRIRFTLIHELANITQGCFKNGTTPGTRDYRWFAGFYLIIRIIIIFIIDQKWSDLAQILIPSAMSLILVFLRPYRVDWCNYLDAFFWSVLSFSNTWFLYYVAFNDIWRDLPNLLKCIPMLYIIGYVLWKIFLRVKASCISWARKSQNTRNNTQERANDYEQLPDRLLHPEEYSPLLKPVST